MPLGAGCWQASIGTLDGVNLTSTTGGGGGSAACAMLASSRVVSVTAGDIINHYFTLAHHFLSTIGTSIPTHHSTGESPLSEPSFPRPICDSGGWMMVTEALACCGQPPRHRCDSAAPAATPPPAVRCPCVVRRADCDNPSSHRVRSTAPWRHYTRFISPARSSWPAPPRVWRSPTSTWTHTTPPNLLTRPPPRSVTPPASGQRIASTPRATRATASSSSWRAPWRLCLSDPRTVTAWCEPAWQQSLLERSLVR